MYNTLTQALKELELHNLSVVCHYPLSKLISSWSALNEEEQTFAKSPFAHIDFLIYNNITKRPQMAIEVDGWSFHKESSVQEVRDKLKDSILSKYALPLYRISTTDTITINSIKKQLEENLVNKAISSEQSTGI